LGILRRWLALRPLVRIAKQWVSVILPRKCGDASRFPVQLGVPLENVIRTRIILTNIDDWEAVTKVHGEFFSSIKPVTTVMAVSRFINPEWLVETEVDAVMDSD
jgi:hypothetical protein